MAARRTPLIGFNHNIKHLGWDFHVQTEDSGEEHPHIITHLFKSGGILASRKVVYAPDDAEEAVRKLMKFQHKAVLMELRDGFHDAKIKEYLGEPPKPGAARRSGSFPKPGARVPTPPAVPAAPVASWPQPAAGESFEWAASFAPPPAGVAVMERPVPAPVARRSTKNRTMVLRAVDYFVPSARASARLPVELHGGQGLLEAYFPNGHLGGLLIAGPSSIPSGSVVELAIRLDDAVVMEMTLKGRVAFLQAALGRLGVELMPNEGLTVDRMLAIARRAAPGKRRRQRVSSAVNATVTHASGSLDAPASLVEGGAFLHTARVIPVGDGVMLQLQPPGGLSTLKLRAQVLWQRAGAEPGMGLSFDVASPAQREAVRDAVLRLLEL